MLRLILECLKIGLFSIGGGLATFPYLVEMSEKFQYFTYNDLLMMLAISESTPGAIGINMMTFAGLKVAPYGGVITVIALITPPFIITIIIANMLKSFKDNKYVKNILYYLRAASLGFIISAIVPSFTSLFKGYNPVLISGAVLVLFFVINKIKKIHPAFLIIGALIIGLVIDFVIL